MRLEPRPAHQSRNRLYAIRQCVTLFPERKLVGIVEVHDLAVAERGCDQALAPEQALAAESLSQNLQVAHAVEQRQNDSVRSDRRRE